MQDAFTIFSQFFVEKYVSAPYNVTYMCVRDNWGIRPACVCVYEANTLTEKGFLP